MDKQRDRELLEAAAKAAGMKVDIVGDGVSGGAVTFYSKPGSLFWNPLTDDGDALRLAVKLRINIEHMTTMGGKRAGVNCWPVGRGDAAATEEYDDQFAATRRAIVRAAAEMGKSHG